MMQVLVLNKRVCTINARMCSVYTKASLKYNFRYRCLFAVNNIFASLYKITYKINKEVCLADMQKSQSIASVNFVYCAYVIMALIRTKIM